MSNAYAKFTALADKLKLCGLYTDFSIFLAKLIEYVVCILDVFFMCSIAVRRVRLKFVIKPYTSLQISKCYRTIKSSRVYAGCG